MTLFYSPKQCRGKVGMSTGIFVQLGLFSGSLLGMPALFGSAHTWWMLYLAELGLLALVAALFSFLHESPGFLVFKGFEAEARAAVKFYYACPDAQADRHLRELKQNMDTASRSAGMLQVGRSSCRLTFIPVSH